ASELIAGIQWGSCSTAAGEIVSVGQCGKHIAVASGNVCRGVNDWCWDYRYHKAALCKTVWRGACLGIYINGLCTGNDIAGIQWGSCSTGTGDVVSPGQCRSHIAVACCNVCMGVNDLCLVYS